MAEGDGRVGWDAAVGRPGLVVIAGDKEADALGGDAVDEDRIDGDRPGALSPLAG